MPDTKLFQSATVKNYSESLSGKVLFCIETPYFCLFVQVSKAGQNLFAAQITQKEFNLFKDYETCECVKCVFDISLDQVLEMAQKVCEGEDIQELVLDYEAEYAEEIEADAENDAVDYWQEQSSLSWS